MRKLIEKLFLLILLIVVTIPVLNMNTKSDSISSIDNTKLPDFPVYTEFDTFTTGFENYFNYRIGYRDKAISTYINFYDKTFNEMIHPNYAYGKEGHVFPRINRQIKDYEFLELFVKNLEKMQNFCEERQIVFLYCIEPSKSTVMQEYLPRGINYNVERYEYLISLLENYQINYVDNRSVLIEKSKTSEVFNRKFDAAHWNDIGEFHGTNSIINKLSTDLSELKPIKLID